MQGTIMLPGHNGGANWGSSAVDPNNGRLFVVSKELPTTANLRAPQPPATAAAGAPLLSLSAQSASETHWALLSDTHIPADTANVYRGFKPHDNLKKIIPEVVDAKPRSSASKI
jgi:hypothetical protein